MASDAVFKTIEERDDQRLKATLARDIDTVESLMGATMRYVHGSGADEDRTLYLQRLRDGYYRYHALEPKRREYRRFGDVVLVHGDVRIKVTVNANDRDFVSRYLQVWANEGGAWKMVAWESTPLPAGA